MTSSLFGMFPRVIFASICVFMARRQKRNVYLWGMLGFLFSFLAAIVLFVLYIKEMPKEENSFLNGQKSSFLQKWKEIYIKVKSEMFAHTSEDDSIENDKKRSDDSSTVVSDEMLEKTKLAILMKKPYENIGQVLKVRLMLASPVYNVTFLSLLRYGLKNEFGITADSVKDKMHYLSDYKYIDKELQKHERQMLELILGEVGRISESLKKMDDKFPKDLFQIDDRVKQLLKIKIESFADHYRKGIIKLESNKGFIDETMGENRGKNLFKEMTQIIKKQKCIKKLENKCFISALGIIVESSISTYKGAGKHFVMWCQEYDELYFDIANEYYKNMDRFSDEIVQVIVNDFEKAHRFFMRSEAKSVYIAYIKQLLQKSFDQRDLEYKETELNKMSEFYR